MNWSDERYVRLYTRDTVTWKRWHWQTRAVLALLIRRVDRSGVLDAGKGDKAEAMALMLEVPVEVARGALEQMVACGTVTVSDTAIVLPSFIDAQEAKQTDKVRQIESRERRAAAAMRNHESACHTPSQPVTAGHTVSQIVTPAVPSRAVPSRAVPVGGALAPPVEAPAKKARPKQPKADEPPTPGWQLLVSRVVQASPGYAFGGDEATALKGCLDLAKGDHEEIVMRWCRALSRTGYPLVRDLKGLRMHWNYFGATQQREALPVFDRTEEVQF